MTDKQQHNMNKKKIDLPFSEMSDFLAKSAKDLDPALKSAMQQIGNLTKLKEQLLKTVDVKILQKESNEELSKTLTDKHTVIVEFKTKEQAEKFYNKIK